MVDPAKVPLDALTAALLGALQGVAEFLPISSSGHLALAQHLLAVDPESGGHRFNVVVHAGTLLAVLAVYRKDLGQLIYGVLHPDEVPHARDTILALIVGSLPLGIVLLPGVENLVVAVEQNVRLVGVALLVTAGMLAFSHSKDPPEDDPNLAPSLAQSLMIGVAQLLAVPPGISRSGSTIAAALALGMGRSRAARFSFLLSIPAVSAAALKEVVEILGDEGAASVDWTPLAVGFVVSFGVGLAALQGLLALLRRFGMMPFVPYLVAAGLAAIVLAG